MQLLGLCYHALPHAHHTIAAPHHAAHSLSMHPTAAVANVCMLVDKWAFIQFVFPHLVALYCPPQPPPPPPGV